MKRLLSLLALSGGCWLVAPAAALAQRTDSTSVKPQLPTGPPMTPPARPPQQPPRPAQSQPPAQPSTTIGDDGRPAQPLPGTPVPTVPPTQRPGGGIDDDGRPAQQLPQSGTVPEATSQDSSTPSKYFLYTNFSLGLSSGVNVTQFNVGASPAIGYRITERLAVGPGFTYTFNNFSLSRDVQQLGYPKNISCHNVGVKGFAQLIVVKQFFLHGELEVTRAQLVPDPLILGGPYKISRTITTPLLGAGYRNQLGNRAAADITLLFNFNDGIEDIYGQPVIRFSFLFDLGK